MTNPLFLSSASTSAGNVPQSPRFLWAWPYNSNHVLKLFYDKEISAFQFTLDNKSAVIKLTNESVQLLSELDLDNLTPDRISDYALAFFKNTSAKPHMSLLQHVEIGRRHTEADTAKSELKRMFGNANFNIVDSYHNFLICRDCFCDAQGKFSEKRLLKDELEHARGTTESYAHQVKNIKTFFSPTENSQVLQSRADWNENQCQQEIQSIERRIAKANAMLQGASLEKASLDAEISIIKTKLLAEFNQLRNKLTLASLGAVLQATDILWKVCQMHDEAATECDSLKSVYDNYLQKASTHRDELYQIVRALQIKHADKNIRTVNQKEDRLLGEFVRSQDDHEEKMDALVSKARTQQVIAEKRKKIDAQADALAVLALDQPDIGMHVIGLTEALTGLYNRIQKLTESNQLAILDKVLGLNFKDEGVIQSIESC